jgi:hypothetical protein
MKEKLPSVLLALVLSLGVIPLTYAQDNQTQSETNATATTNTTSTETNVTLPVEPIAPIQLPSFPETNQTQTEIQPAVNRSESNNNATRVLGLLDDAQVKIDEARNIIRALQAQVQEGRDNAAATNDTDQIIQDANDTAEQIEDIIEGNLTDSEVISDVGNITEDIEQAINDTIESAPNATVDNIENLTDEAIEVVENATDNTENATIEVAIDNAMIRLLSGLVSAQDYNQGLSTEERDDLKANLQDAIAELASDAADSLR